MPSSVLRTRRGDGEDGARSPGLRNAHPFLLAHARTRDRVPTPTPTNLNVGLIWVGIVRASDNVCDGCASQRLDVVEIAHAPLGVSWLFRSTR